MTIENVLKKDPLRVTRKESVSDKKRNYTPSHLLSTSARKERRRKGRKYVRKFRLEQKLHTETGQEEEINTSGYESVGSSVSNLIVSMPFSRRAAGPRMRVSKELTEGKEKLMNLKNKNIELARKLKSEQRKNQRLKRLHSSGSSTPRSKAEKSDVRSKTLQSTKRYY